MNERRRTLLLSGGYKIPTENGVYIESVEHEFYLPDDWDTANTANSIAVVTDEHKFRIALYDAPSSMQMNTTNSDTWTTALTGTTNSGTVIEIVACTDYSGATNTQLIVEKCQSSTACAAGWCDAYTFPDGVTKGYLPALGELYLTSQRKSAINAALAKCGGSAFDTDTCYWASTFYGTNGNGKGMCWFSCIGDNGYAADNLYHFAYVRPFAILEDSN